MNSPERPFKNLHEITRDKEEAPRSRIFEVPGRPDLIVREMPKNYGSWDEGLLAHLERQRRELNAAEKIEPHLKMRRTLEELDRHVAVPKYHLVEYEQEGKKVVGAVVEKVEGETFEKLALTPENAPALDDFIAGCIAYTMESWKEGREVPEEFLIDGFIYGHRIDRQGKAREKDKMFHVDIDPDYTTQKGTMMGSLREIFLCMQEKVEAYRERGGERVEFPKTLVTLRELVSLYADTLLEDIPEEANYDYTNVENEKDIAIEFREVLETL